ncbi:hypothetical protein LOK49_LG07G01458 [Camellia lanceoleosa]|uniref:Uncharacterized protein n=1 Tax=Camellia lanceoleosa TaxID=1840588 RepID=A0ACC0H212_9ERIC|nr:hypothetical protein LOK49_LG07G01458 [Camellia lanceoleosa]
MIPNVHHACKRRFWNTSTDMMIVILLDVFCGY